MDRRLLSCPAAIRAPAYQVLAPEAYVQIKTLVEKTVASGLIYMNSHAADFAAPELAISRLYSPRLGWRLGEERVKLMKLLWERSAGIRRPARAVRNQLSGSHEEIRRYALFGASLGQCRPLERLCRKLPRGIRPQWLVGAGSGEFR